MAQQKVLTRAVIHKVVTKKDLEDAKMTLDEYLVNLMINKKININHDFKFRMDFHMNINGFEFIAMDIQRNGIYEVVWVGGVNNDK